MQHLKCSRQLIIFILALLTWLTPLGESLSIGGGRSEIGVSAVERSGRFARKVGAGTVVGGLGTYAGYRNLGDNNNNKNFNNKGPNPDSSESLAYSENFIVLESTYSQRREGSGMSAWTLLMIILGIIGLSTICWYCYAIGVPLWRDRQASRRRTYQMNVSVKGSGDDLPLHETPSTATPSP